MDPKKLFLDDRFRGVCSYCGAVADSRDHVPSRILLDEPYPDNLPVAESCVRCNKGFSLSEEYLACFIECVIQGTTTPDDNFRPKVVETLKARPSIRQRIENCKRVDGNNQTHWVPEAERVEEIVLKLARGHIAYELGLQHIEEPEAVEITPIPCMSEDQLRLFFSLENEVGSLYPEIGSRAFINVLSGKPTAYDQWHVVQRNRYQYVVGQSCGDWVKIVLSNYLACRVAWG
jgi:hypothetical protein